MKYVEYKSGCTHISTDNLVNLVWAQSMLGFHLILCASCCPGPPPSRPSRASKMTHHHPSILLRLGLGQEVSLLHQAAHLRRTTLQQVMQAKQAPPSWRLESWKKVSTWCGSGRRCVNSSDKVGLSLAQFSSVSGLSTFKGTRRILAHMQYMVVTHHHCSAPSSYIYYWMQFEQDTHLIGAYTESLASKSD